MTAWTPDELDRIGAADPAVDAAYREKYARYPSYVEPMVGEAARATRLKLVPAE